VHSFSRFFRDAFGLEFYVRKLTKHGVKLVSITQEPGDDPAQVMMRQAIALFDEYQSKENAKALLGSLIDRVEVDDREVRIVGRREALEHAILASGQAPGKVHSYVPNWRPRQDSNLRPSD
jgi:hypothetical protein